jgi:hypothetical protein
MKTDRLPVLREAGTRFIKGLLLYPWVFNGIIFIALLILLWTPFRLILLQAEYPYPLAGAESTPIISAITIHEGDNPYTLSKYPEKMYIYGGLFPLLIAPWIDIIEPLILIPRLINAISYFLSILVMFALLRRRNASIIGSLVGTIILAYALCLILQITFSGPDLIGFFIFIFGFYLFELYGLSFPGILLSALSGICCLLIKQYFLLPAVFLGPFILFFRSKKLGVLYLGCLFLMGLSIAVPIRLLFPLYFRYTILHFLHVVSNDVGHMVFQFSIFFQWFFFLIVLYFIGLAVQIYRKGPPPKWEIKINFRVFDKPLFEGIPLDVYKWSFACMFLVLALYLGKNTGNAHTYFLELLLPFLLLAGIPIIEKAIAAPMIRIGSLLACLTCVIPMALGYSIDLQGSAAKYQRLSTELKSCKVIYAASYANLILLDQHQPIYDSGHTNLGYTIILPYEAWRARLLGGHDGSIENRWNQWNRQLGERVKNREFDCIAVYGQTDRLGDVLLSDYYQPKTVIPDLMEWDAVTLKIEFDAVLWIPKDR